MRRAARAGTERGTGSRKARAEADSGRVTTGCSPRDAGEIPVPADRLFRCMHERSPGRGSIVLRSGAKPAVPETATGQSASHGHRNDAGGFRLREALVVDGERSGANPEPPEVPRASRPPGPARPFASRDPGGGGCGWSWQRDRPGTGRGRPCEPWRAGRPVGPGVARNHDIHDIHGLREGYGVRPGRQGTLDRPWRRNNRGRNRASRGRCETGGSSWR
jgi:hypothetical protein